MNYNNHTPASSRRGLRVATFVLMVTGIVSYAVAGWPPESHDSAGGVISMALFRDIAQTSGTTTQTSGTVSQ